MSQHTPTVTSVKHKNERTPIKPDDEAQLLTECHRRCCMCAFLNNDWRQKRGQIAHVDRNPSNSSYTNLAYLCLDHHAEYDATSKQYKGYRPDELLRHKEYLKKNVEQQIKKGVTFANDVGLVPYVIAVEPTVESETATVTLRNYTAVPGLVTDVKLHTGNAVYRWYGKLVIGMSEVIPNFFLRVEDWLEAAPIEYPQFEIEVCDLSEVVSVVRHGTADRMIFSCHEVEDERV